MTETELIAAIRVLALHRSRRTHMARLSNPAASSSLRAAQTRAADFRSHLDRASGRIRASPRMIRYRHPQALRPF